MEISTLTNNVNTTNPQEIKKSAESPEPKAKEEKENTPDSVQNSTASVSELLTIESGGTVTHSIDGDTVELSANATAITAGTQTSAKIDTADTDSETEATTSENSSSRATTMVLQGYSDSRIKEETGISQQELDRIKQTLE